MEYRKLGNLDVSVIGLGTLRTFDVTDQDEIAVRRQIVDNCLDSDVNLIDTAAWYGNAEQVLGEITEDHRDRFYIATKVRIEGKEAGEAQIARSFELLQTDYIDLFQVHNMIDWQTHLPTLERLKGEGNIGMSSSFIITSNRAVEEWLSLFDDPILGNSALDRLANASYQIVIDGTSYRERLSPHRALLSTEGGD